mmetsp:Transcript_7441/g.17994  ORF Transcript_7441/g.17994 Transcript_7441/m.17994 type:complete len:105 (+) Transcript_7441:171-485(+)
MSTSFVSRLVEIIDEVWKHNMVDGVDHPIASFNVCHNNFGKEIVLSVTTSLLHNDVLAIAILLAAGTAVAAIVHFEKFTAKQVVASNNSGSGVEKKNSKNRIVR